MAMKKAARKPAKKKAPRKAAKASVKRSAARKSAKPVKARPKVRQNRASGGRGTPWFDATSHKPLINEYAERMKTFTQTMADGQVDKNELKAQENRLISSMQEVEPMLNGRLHQKVTRLLCELAAYDMMQSLRMIQDLRQPTVFQG